MPMHDDLQSLRRQAAKTTLRLRLSDGARRAALVLPLPLVYATAALTYVKVAQPSAGVERVLIVVGILPAAFAVGAVIQAIMRRRPWYVGALALDRHYGLQDRITNALAFSKIASNERAPLMQAAIDDAVAVAKAVSPRRAAPIRLPKDMIVSVALAVAVFGISLLEVRRARFVPPNHRDFAPMVMSPDDVDLFREAAEEMAAHTEDPQVKITVQRFNQLLEDIAERRIDRQEVFRKLQELEENLVQSTELDASALDEALEGVANELKKSELSKKAGEALENKQLKDAEQAMRELAEKLKDKKPVDKARLEQLRKALERASKANSERRSQQEEERKDLESKRKRLLEKKKKEGLSDKEQQELEKLDRQLERLDRQTKRTQSAERQMSDLDRDLAKAAQDLMKELGQGAKDLQKSAQDLNKTARQQMSQKEKEALKKRLQELRELMRQQGQGGKDRMTRLMRFGQQARGGRSGQGGGQQGQSGQEQGKGKQGDGKETMLMMKPGSGQGQGMDILMPGAGQPLPGAGEQPGQNGAGKGGSEWGRGDDPNVKGDKTDLAGKSQDVTAAGQDTGQGASVSEVIYGAAERGFVGRGYQKVFSDYHTVAEEALEQDQIPPGYEFYVRRYFQLIRPRD